MKNKYLVTKLKKVTKAVTTMKANIRLIHDRKNEAKGDRNAIALLQVEIRLTGGTKRIFISTNERISKNQFTYKNGNFTCKDHASEIRITKTIRSMLSAITEFANSDKCRVLEDVKKYDSEESFTSQVTPFIEKEMKGRGLRLSTIKQHNVIIRKLSSFGKIETFDDLTYKNIESFDQHMKKEGKMSLPSVHKKHSTLSSYLKEAVRKGLLSQNPYDIFKPKRGKSKDPVFLTEEELQRIIDWKPTSERLEKVKDLFLFQCFTGMAFSDMEKFDKSEIHKEGEYEVIRSSRKKTDERFVTLLLPEAKAILVKHTFILPVISNQKYNDYIKVIMEYEDVKIVKNVTSHTARHTYAVYLLNKGVPIEAVSVSMGHSNIKMTQHYAKLMAKSTVSAIADKLLKKD